MGAPTRPWVTPAEVKAYSELPNVQNRADAKLAVDITRAEEYVLNYTHNDFSDYTEIPVAVKTAIILLAERYGNTAANTSGTITSETFDDYSWSGEASASSFFENSDITSLLDPYVVTASKGRVTFRMRKL